MIMSTFLYIKASKGSFPWHMLLFWKAMGDIQQSREMSSVIWDHPYFLTSINILTSMSLADCCNEFFWGVMSFWLEPKYWGAAVLSQLLLWKLFSVGYPVILKVPLLVRNCYHITLIEDTCAQSLQSYFCRASRGYALSEAAFYHKRCPAWKSLMPHLGKKAVSSVFSASSICIV